MDRQLKQRIRRLRVWVYGRKMINIMLWCLPAGVFVGAIMEIVACAVPWYHVHAWAAAAVAAGAVFGGILSLLHVPSGREAALELDRTGLNERTVTALELLGDDSAFATLQKQDAWKQISAEPIHRRLPLRVSWKRPALLLFLIFVLVGGGLLPSASKTEAANRHLLAEKAAEEVAKVEQAEEELKSEADISESEWAEYQNMLEDIRKELKEADSQEALEKALERAEKKLNQAAEKTENEKAKERMQQLAQSLNGDSDSKNTEGNDRDSLLAAGEQQKAAEAAEEALERLQQELAENGDLSGLSEEERQELAEALEKLASLSENDLSESELADLQELASQISSGNLNGDLASAQATVSALKSSAGEKLAAAQNGSENSGSSGEGSSGEGSGSEGGEGSGSGSGEGSGSGSGEGSGSGNGSGSGGSGTGWNYGSNQGTEKNISYEGEMVSIPNETGEDENLTGQKNDGSSYGVTGGDSLTWSGNQVRYDQVIGDYSKQAMSQIESSDYPSGVQDIIKSYFETIQGE